jgi:menaquinone-dependent protoporphyrinogen oxidase
MDTTPRVLVAYATAAGSTAGVAERVAEVLRRWGAEVLCRPVGPDVEPADFDAFVLGSAVHNMAWLPPAIDFLHRVAPHDRPVWCFSVGGITPKGAITRRLTDRELQVVAQRFPAGFEPRGHRIFGGIIQMKGTPLWGRLFFRMTGGRPGDHRDWPAIEAWAESIARELQPRDGRRTTSSSTAGTTATPTATPNSAGVSGTVPSRSDSTGT